MRPRRRASGRTKSSRLGDHMSHYYELLNDGAILTRHETSGRPTTKRDVKKWLKEGRAICPSVSTIIALLSRPGLEYWRTDVHLDSAYQLMLDAGGTSTYEDFVEIIGKDVGAFKERVRLMAGEAMSKAPDAGTRFHAAMSDFIKGNLGQDHEHFRLCEKAMFLLCDKLKKPSLADFESEVQFCKWVGDEVGAGFGGTADLVAGNDLIDIKTKSTALGGSNSKLVKEDHVIQLAAYAAGLGMDDPQCHNLYVSLLDGECRLVTHKPADIIIKRQVFAVLTALWWILIS